MFCRDTLWQVRDRPTRSEVARRRRAEPNIVKRSPTSFSPTRRCAELLSQLSGMCRRLLIVRAGCG